MTERRQARRGTLIPGSGFAGKLFTRTYDLLQPPRISPKLQDGPSVLLGLRRPSSTGLSHQASRKRPPALS
jgi:hypothetical protein